MMCYKNVVIAGLKSLQQHERMSDDPTRGFKIRAYQKAITAVTSIQGCLENPSQLDGLLTATMLRKAKDMIANAPAVEPMDARSAATKETALLELQKIAGIGPVAAQRLVEEHGVRSVDELVRRQHEPALKLNAKQLLGIRHFADMLNRIPREEIDAHAQVIKDNAKRVGLHAEIVGSYRRGAESSGDIDALITWKANARRGAVRDEESAQTAFTELVANLEQVGYLLADNFAHGSKKYMGVARIAPGSTVRRVDLLLTPPSEHAFALLYFTGSKEFNVHVRKMALQKGLSLNEHGLTDTRTRQRINPTPALATEKDILTYLGVDWVPPKKREWK